MRQFVEQIIKFLSCQVSGILNISHKARKICKSLFGLLGHVRAQNQFSGCPRASKLGMTGMHSGGQRCQD